MPSANQRTTLIVPVKKKKLENQLRLNVFSNSSRPEEKYIKCMNPLHENLNIIEFNVDISITFSLQMNQDKLYKNKTEIYKLTVRDS